MLRSGERRSLCWIAVAGLALALVIVVTALTDEAARRHLVPASDGMDAQTDESGR